MNSLIMIAADLAAISLLTFALYLRRHRRRDLMVSYLGVNVGVLAVATALSGSAAGIGLGLGLIGGIGTNPLWLGLALMALIVLIVLVMFAGDHPRVLPSYRHQTVILDRAVGGEAELFAQLEAVLGAKVHTATVQELDPVNDKTTVEVRYAYLPGGQHPPVLDDGAAPAQELRLPAGVA